MTSLRKRTDLYLTDGIAEDRWQTMLSNDKGSVVQGGLSLKDGNGSCHRSQKSWRHGVGK